MSNAEIYFKDIDQIGNLYIVECLLEFEFEDIIFICEDNNKKQYVCLCYEFRYRRQWILCETTVELINKLKENKVDIYSVFENSTAQLVQLKSIGDNKETVNFISFDNFDKALLPKKGVFLSPNASDENNEIYLDTYTNIKRESIDNNEYLIKIDSNIGMSKEKVCVIDFKLKLDTSHLICESNNYKILSDKIEKRNLNEYYILAS